MTVPSNAIETLREQWSTRFVDAIAATRLTDRGALNPTTLEYDGTTRVDVYIGPALIRPSENIDRAEYGQALVTGTPMDVYLRHDAAEFEVEDDVAITVCGFDAELVGQTMTVVGWENDSYLTRRRLVCRLDLGGGLAS